MTSAILRPIWGITLLFALCQVVSANAPWNGVLEEVEAHPRINVVHVDTSEIHTQYYFLAAIPMVLFHHNQQAYSSLLIPDLPDDETFSYLLEDWKTYLDQHPLQRHANFIGGVPDSIQEQIRLQFNIVDDQDVDTLHGTPIEVAARIAEKDWQHSEFVVIAPYKASLTDHDIESISNAAVLASLVNGPLLFTEPSSLSSEVLGAIAKIGADKAILVEIDDVLSDNIATQLADAGISMIEDLLTESDVVTSVITKSGRSTLCGIVNRWQHLPAALTGARYGGYVLFLPTGLNRMAKELHDEILSDPELQSRQKLEEPLERREWVKLTEDEIAVNFYDWLTSVSGNDPDSLETVITFEPQGTGGGDLETTFERAISGDPSDLDRPGAITGRMPLDWSRNIALANRTGMYRAMIFANPRPHHVTLCMNAYEVRHTPDTGSPVPDSWGLNHIINEMFGWPYRGWVSGNDYFPWDDIHADSPDLSPILPPGNGHGADHDPGQFASFLSSGYETHFHSGAYPGTGSHPAQPEVENIGFVADMNQGSSFLYFSCHGGGTSISVRHTDNGIAQDGGAPGWGEPYWPDDDERVYDGSGGGDYSQTDLENDLENARGMMIAYNACGMANGYMNEILLEHGGTASIGSYISVSFTGSGWWWNTFVHLTTHEDYTVGEAAAYATARVSDLTIPPAKAEDTSLRYVLYGDPNCPFVQTDWLSPPPQAINEDYGGHKPDKPDNEFAGSVSPDTITVAVPTLVTVTLLDSLGIGVDSAFVNISGWGVLLSDTTDGSGTVQFNVESPYGELLVVTGEKPNFDTFIDTIYVVGGIDFAAAEVTAWVTEVGLYDTLTPYYEGTIVAETDQAGFTLHAHGCGVDTSVTAIEDSVTLLVTPLSPGVLQTGIGKTGFNMYTKGIPVITVTGTLDGAVIDEGTLDSLPDVELIGYTGGADTSMSVPVFQVVTDSTGIYVVSSDLAVGEYDIYVREFGYLPFAGTEMVMYGSNTYDVFLTPAPAGTVFGYVKESGTLVPLAATVRVYRNDTMELYAETTTDPGTGYYEMALPYFSYDFRVTAYHHVPSVRTVTVSGESLQEDFYLTPTQGNFLVVDATEPGRNARDDNGLSEPKESSDTRPAGSKSPETFVSDLIELGYSVEQDTAGTTDPMAWPSYDLLIFSIGDNVDDISSSMKDALVEYVVDPENILLIEGGEIGYDNRDGSDFQHGVLNIGDGWYGDEEGNMTVSDEEHPLTTTPNLLPSLIEFNYDGGWGSSDALEVYGDAGFVTVWTEDMMYPGVIYSDEQIVFYTFDYDDIVSEEDRISLLENTVDYLLPRSGCVVGSVTDSETSQPIAGAFVTTSGAGSTTDSAGTYLLSLRPGMYTVTAGKSGYNSSSTSGVDVTQDDTLVLDFSLNHPEIDVDPDSLSVDVLVGATLDTSLSVTNDGNGPLIFEITLLPSSSPWISVVPTADTVPASGTLEVAVTFDATDTSLVVDTTYAVELRMSNNTLDNPVDVTARMTVTEIAPFIRGDVNGSMDLSMDDAIYSLKYLYIPGSPNPTCMDAADADDNGLLTMSDVLYTLQFLYVPGSPVPPHPFPDCGYDPTSDELECGSHPCESTRRPVEKVSSEKPGAGLRNAIE